MAEPRLQANPNMQNIPASPFEVALGDDAQPSGPRSMTITPRNCFTSRPGRATALPSIADANAGYTLVSADFAQIELRVLAHVTSPP